jgi:DNA replicative helicase MCM subunit Mcm2 (Cdc46/Mcm family)
METNIKIIGKISKIDDLKFRAKVIPFECKYCGRIFKIPQSSNFFKKTTPGPCVCGKKDFSEILEIITSEDIIEHQKGEIEIYNGLPRKFGIKKIPIIFENGLVNKNDVGETVELDGILSIYSVPKVNMDVFKKFVLNVKGYKKIVSG